MTAAEFVRLANELIFAVIAVVTIARAVRLRTTPSIEIALFFSLIVAIQQMGRMFDLLGLGDAAIGGRIGLALFSLLPYVLIRIVDHFTQQARWQRLGALAVTLGVIISGLAAPEPMLETVAVIIVAWVVAGGGYASVMFVLEARRSAGVTSRRLQAAAIGSGLLAVALLVALAGLFAPGLSEITPMATVLLATACGLAYYAGFATPTWLRRTWQEPAVRDFLAHSADLTREPDERIAIRRMADLTGEVMGTGNALIGLATDDGARLRWIGADGEDETPADRWIPGRAFSSGKVVLSRNPAADDPVNADTYRAAGAGTIMAAPMVAADRRYGVLVVYAGRAPVFAYSDRDLITVLAQQAAGILEARTLLREAAEVQARDVATQAKEDFLSAAAHDLRTPLSSMVLRAELLGRRLEREGSPHAEAMSQVIADAGRVTEFVEDLLDAARAEHGRLSRAGEPVDLASIVHEVVESRPKPDHEITIHASPAWVMGDRRRLQQVIENLVSNAQKYTPGGEPIVIRVSTENGMACVSVADQGIGVAVEDLPNLFQRFNRGRNVDDRRFSGLGLGLYICRRIVEEHDGRIWAESEVGRGTTMRFEIPATSEAST